MTLPVCVVVAALAVTVLAGCGGDDEPSLSPPSSSAPSDTSSAAPLATSQDVCGLLPDDVVVEATGLDSLAGPAQPQDVGAFLQCEWDPVGRDGNVVRVTLAYLPYSPDNVSSELDSSPAEEGVGDHVREDTSATSEYLEVVSGDAYLSVSLDDNAQLLDDAPSVARDLVTQAFAALA